MQVYKEYVNFAARNVEDMVSFRANVNVPALSCENTLAPSRPVYIDDNVLDT